MNLVKVKFPESEYFQEKTKKELIVLHHTVSCTAKSSIDWWQQDKGGMRVATSYVVDKDGTIYQLFDDSFWAYHIGKGSTKYHNQRSIGIEIVNEGPLEDKTGEGLFWFDGRARFNGVPYYHSWRGEYAWAPYDDVQFNAVVELCHYLCKYHDIPKIVLTDYLFKPSYKVHHGIASHHNLSVDKTDVSPAFNLLKFKEMLWALK
ncbi:MAG TPA: N-acetylmuramoyl-L-alanine amidase [Ignavibacteriaceae bacterium]|nr:N-acetylmuramoyl-L-alanine amidase [Ignavibacteriaceae bacterium]